MSKLWLENSNNPVSMWQTTSPVGDWIDVTNDMCKCARYGLRSGMDIDTLIDHLKSLYDGVWATKTDEEKQCLASFCIASKADRDTISFLPEVMMTNGYAQHEFAIHDMIRAEFRHSFLINEIDFKSIRQMINKLDSKETIVKGHLTKKEYFESYNRSTGVGTNKVLEYSATYTLDSLDNLETKDFTYSWFLNDNTTVGVSTSGAKHYDWTEALNEGKRRRGNIIVQLELAIPQLLVTTGDALDIPIARDMGRDFFRSHEANFASYKQNKDGQIYIDITNDVTFTWLSTDIGGGVTIRDYILNEMTY